MFRDSLLENSLTTRKRWPVLLAFTLEVLVGAAMVAIPLLSSGVIPVSAHAPIYSPLMDVSTEPEVRHQPDHSGNHGPTMPASNVVTIVNTHPMLTIGHPRPDATKTGEIVSVPKGSKSASDMPNLDGGCDHCSSVSTEPIKRMRYSTISEGQLIHRVEPAYPRIAIMTRQQGEVKLHAIIGRDGSIQNLAVESGLPLLAAAAVEAVKQWRYRPFLLNGQPVEVETTITVNFRRSGD
ncbi:MAG TPA: energy transducer TonB [Candidatus Limnocylindrales bacterium]|nr:energy transducer TonB [Candidatus Limnocylindrales bacterium]